MSIPNTFKTVALTVAALSWLLASKGAFNLTMRLYGPKPEALNGKWNPPAVKRL
ncbi:hypothetical protein [Pseudomonas sp. Irchel s3h17]|uniref:hypothetical protein n=1 Tax=Pseudomonas sp. Irchel s3h17 TaxID=2009182 RepID=UPI00155E90FE|nr:hypothetical protein [Pseudomonas sp. Irchel s3h17]